MPLGFGPYYRPNNQDNVDKWDVADVFATVSLLLIYGAMIAGLLFAN